MPFVSDRYEFIYFAAPATGSSVTLKAFLKAKIGGMIPAAEMFEGGKLVCPSKHGTYRDLINHNLITERQKKYVKVTGIRNPFSYYVNQYTRANFRLRQIDEPKSHFAGFGHEERERLRQEYLNIINVPFEEYLKKKLDAEEPFLPWGRFIWDADIFLRQEWLADDLAALRDIVGLRPRIAIKGRSSNTSSGPKEYMSYYNPELISMVYKLNKPFFDRFPEYSFGV